MTSAPAHTILNCPACGSNANRSVFDYRDTHPIHECSDCGTQFCRRRFSGEELESFYSGEYFQGEFGYKNYAALEAIKRRTFASRLERLEAECPARGRLLDVGCANGLLVRTALDRGWDAHGIDISRFATDEATRDHPELIGRVHVAVLENSGHAPESFDALVLSDMIEHVHDPIEATRQALKLLKPGGRLFVETPNLAGMMRRVMGAGWPMYRPPEHLVYFTPSSLKAMLEREGFTEIVRRSSWKALTWNYVMDKLVVTFPRLVAVLKPLGKPIGDLCVWIPAGSFWSISVKKNDAK